MSAQPPFVSIVLATFNGASFLRAQLRSLRAQSYENWCLALSDDGSHDDTLEIARREIPAAQLKLLEGPRQGLALNFWNALRNVPDGHFAAFCDQDDVWRRDKLERAISQLTAIKGPALYSAGRIVTDVHLNPIRIQHRSPVKGFAQTFFRNPVAGHTCVLSPEAVTLLKHHPPSHAVPFHDWWATLVLSKLGACFVHDPEPVLYYRQHGANVLGARGGRARTILNGTYFRWLNANQKALRICLPSRAGLSLGKD